MTPAEASDLLTRCAAFDNRQPSIIAANAWAHALRDLPLDDDAFAAVDRFYGTPPEKPGERLWIQPHDVRTHRKIIRAERLANFVYEPPPDDHDPQYRARLKRQLDAVGSGRIAGPDSPPALAGGPHPDVAEKIAGIGREVPDVDDDPEVAAIKRVGPFTVKCPKCAAAIGRPCRIGIGADHALGKERPQPHPARRRAAQGLPAETEDPQEIERRRRASAARLADLEAEGADR